MLKQGSGKTTTKRVPRRPYWIPLHNYRSPEPIHRAVNSGTLVPMRPSSQFQSSQKLRWSLVSRYALVAGALLASSCAHQHAYTPTYFSNAANSNEKDDCLPIYLPDTVLNFDVSVDYTKSKTGPMLKLLLDSDGLKDKSAQDAFEAFAKVMGLDPDELRKTRSNKDETADFDKLSIGEPGISGVRNLQKLYFVKIPTGLFVTSTFKATFSNDGRPLTIASDVADHTAETLIDVVKSAAGVAAAFEAQVFTDEKMVKFSVSPLRDKILAYKDRWNTLKNLRSDMVNSQRIWANTGNLAWLSEQAALEMKKIKGLFSTMDETVSVKGKISIHIPQELASQLTPNSYLKIPILDLKEPKSKIRNQIAAKLGSGLEREDDASPNCSVDVDTALRQIPAFEHSAALYVTLELGERVAVSPSLQAPPQDDGGLPYVIPGRIRVNTHLVRVDPDDQKVKHVNLTSTVVPMAQFGTVRRLPVSLQSFHMNISPTYDPATGAITELTTATEAMSAKPFTGVLDAAKTLHDAKKAAEEKEANKELEALRKEAEILELKDKIRKATSNSGT